MTGPALVDVGMTAHGRPLWIGEAVESVLAQSEARWRLTILDDGPGGGEIEHAVAPYVADERVRYVATNQPVSANQAMTEVMGIGDAPYFAFLHDDDCWGPRFLENRLTFLERNPECAFVYSGHTDIDPEGREVEVHQDPLPEGPVDPAVLLPEFALRNAVDTMHSVLVRRDALEAIGARLDPAIRRLYDWELWFRLAVHFPAGYLHAAGDVYYRVHPQQMSSVPGHNQDFLDMYDHVDAVLAGRMPEHRLDDRDRRARRATLLLSVALDHLQEDQPREARAALREAAGERRAIVGQPRFGLALAGVIGGRRVRRAVERLRLSHYRRNHAGS